jgi:hypothetical protein
MKSRIVLSVLVLLMLFGCVSYNAPPQQNNQTVNTQPAVVPCSQMSNRDEGDRCYYNNAIEGDNLTACSFIYSDSLRDSCNLRFAINLTDPSLCAIISNKDVKDDCYHTIAPTVGIATCDKIENATLRKACHLELGDESVLCEGITDDYNYNLCLAKAENNYSICSNITNQSFWDSCYLDFAETKNNYTICSMLSTSGGRDGCYQYFANLTSNVSICDNISSNYTKDVCTVRITGNYSMCNGLSDYLQKDSCFEVYAMEHNSSDICMNVSSQLYQDKCFTDVAVSTGNASTCSRMTCYACISDRESCYTQVANATFNTSICSMITVLMNRDLCYLTVAKTSSDPSACNQMQSSYSRDTCYYSIIYNQTYNLAACAVITYQPWQDECYTEFAVKSNNSAICQKVSDPLTKSQCIQESS